MAIAAKEAMAGHLETLKAKFEEAVEMRKNAELEIEAFRPVRVNVTVSIVLFLKE